jgi:hypothetical protein
LRCDTVTFGSVAAAVGKGGIFVAMLPTLRERDDVVDGGRLGMGKLQLRIHFVQAQAADALVALVQNVDVNVPVNNRDGTQPCPAHGAIDGVAARMPLGFLFSSGTVIRPAFLNVLQARFPVGLTPFFRIGRIEFAPALPKLFRIGRIRRYRTGAELCPKLLRRETDFCGRRLRLGQWGRSWSVRGIDIPFQRAVPTFVRRLGITFLACMGMPIFATTIAGKILNGLTNTTRGTAYKFYGASFTGFGVCRALSSEGAEI